MATTEQTRVSAARISDAFLGAYNDGDVDRIDDVVTDDFVCHHLAGGMEIHGAEEYKARVGELRTAFPDFEMTEELFLVDGEYGAGHYRWGGTHEGEFEGIPATGKRVDTTSLSLTRMADGKVAEMWIYGDGRGLMSQLGVDPR